MYIIGIDIGGTHIRIGMIDGDMQLTNFCKVPQQSVFSSDSPNKLVEFISDYINKYASDKQISAIAIGAPATINRERTTILNAPNVNGLDGLNICEFLGKSFDIPIILDKDVIMLYYYDMHRFNVDTAGVVIACYVGTGIGNVIAIDGKPLTGSNGAAGELGHIPFHGNTDVCGCGNIGCAETCAGGKRLDMLQKQLFPDTPISQVFAVHNEHAAIDDFVKNIAITITAEINILDPETVILGGGVICMEGFPKEKLEQYIRSFARKPMPENNLKFIFSDNSGENGVIGAGIAAIKRP